MDVAGPRLIMYLLRRNNTSKDWHALNRTCILYIFCIMLLELICQDMAWLSRATSHMHTFVLDNAIAWQATITRLVCSREADLGEQNATGQAFKKCSAAGLCCTRHAQSWARYPLQSSLDVHES